VEAFLALHFRHHDTKPSVTANPPPLYHVCSFSSTQRLGTVGININPIWKVRLLIMIILLLLYFRELNHILIEKDAIYGVHAVSKHGDEGYRIMWLDRIVWKTPILRRFGSPSRHAHSCAGARSGAC
jgi:hypothetical protein